MTDQELRVALAKALNLDPYWKCDTHSEVDGPVCRWCGDDALLTSGRTFKPIPDYPQDLNAVHAAIARIAFSQEEDWGVKFVQALWDRTAGEADFGPLPQKLWPNEVFGLFLGHDNPAKSARQRAEALLEVLG